MKITESKLREVIRNIINEDRDLKKAYDAKVDFNPEEVEIFKDEVSKLASNVANDYSLEDNSDPDMYFDNHVEVKFPSYPLTDSQIEDAKSEFMELIGRSE